ncbi:MAG: hypothetical protein ABH867_03775 [Patescibacteria group bacterium]|nr:hypothetical protein [Patescibacteria group bacterium]
MACFYLCFKCGKKFFQGYGARKLLFPKRVIFIEPGKTNFPNRLILLLFCSGLFLVGFLMIVIWFNHWQDSYLNSSTGDFSQVSQTTENWIRSSIGGFEFKYPQEYRLEEKNDTRFTATSQHGGYIVIELGKIVEFTNWIEKIKKNLDAGDSSTDYSRVGQYEVYLESRMDTERVFERNCFVVLGARLIRLTVSIDTTVSGNKEPEIYKEVEFLADQVLSTFRFATGPEGDINNDNWSEHPKIKDSLVIRDEIESEIGSKLLKVETREYEYSQGWWEALRVRYTDENGTIRKYTSSGGSDDSSHTYDYYYDQKGEVRFVLIRIGTVNGSMLDHQTFFDENGFKIWELHEYLSGPGSPLPEEWPLEGLIYTPEVAFQALPKEDACEIVTENHNGIYRLCKLPTALTLFELKLNDKTIKSSIDYYSVSPDKKLVFFTAFDQEAVDRWVAGGWYMLDATGNSINLLKEATPLVFNEYSGESWYPDGRSYLATVSIGSKNVEDDNCVFKCSLTSCEKIIINLYNYGISPRAAFILGNKTHYEVEGAGGEPEQRMFEIGG